MNSERKNNDVNKKKDMLQEPKVIYGDEGNPVSESLEKADAILEKLISKSIQDSNEEKGISHEEMIQKVKAKYPFLK